MKKQFTLLLSILLMAFALNAQDTIHGIDSDSKQDTTPKGPDTVVSSSSVGSLVQKGRDAITSLDKNTSKCFAGYDSKIILSLLVYRVFNNPTEHATILNNCKNTMTNEIILGVTINTIE